MFGWLHHPPFRSAAGPASPARRREVTPAWWNHVGPSADAGDEPIRLPERSYHIPVLPKETMDLLQASPGQVFLDGTLGGGGHSERLLERGARVVALDRDPMALEFAKARLAVFGDRFEARHGEFGAMAELAADRAPFDGILLDIGVSSAQLDSAERGFAFRLNGPLDMRMDPTRGQSAAELIDHIDEAELAQILFQWGEERHSRRIARAIVRARRQEPITSTAQLAEIIAGATPGRPGPVHPATRSFQALRIAVNAELTQLERALAAAPQLLKPGGRLAVITFHSLEDRCVKRNFLATSTPELDDPTWPQPRPNPDCHYRLITRKALIAGERELARNPRARSAKLRVAEKI